MYGAILMLLHFAYIYWLIYVPAASVGVEDKFPAPFFISSFLLSFQIITIRKHKNGTNRDLFQKVDEITCLY